MSRKDPMSVIDRGYVDSLRTVNKTPFLRNCLELFDRYLPQPIPWWEELAQLLDDPEHINAKIRNDVAEMIREAAHEAGE